MILTKADWSYWKISHRKGEILKKEATMKNEYFDRIEDSLSWSDVLLKLGITPQKSGKDLKIKCVFHDENTASLKFINTKLIFICYGCGTGGDQFAFVNRLLGGRKMAVRFFRRNFGIKP